MATLGSLVVSLEANIAKFESDLGRAAATAERAMSRIAEAAGAAGTALGALAGLWSVDKIITFGESLITSTASLAILSKQTGLSVEALSAMRQIAAETGTNIDDVAHSIDILEKNAAAAVSGNTKMESQFKSLGLSAGDLAKGLQKPDELLLTVAQKLASFTDDGNKTAIMMQLLGRSGAQSAAFMAELARQGYESANVTKQQAQAANDYVTSLARLNEQIETVARNSVISILPTLTKIIPGIQLVTVQLVYWFNVAWINIEYGFKSLISRMNSFLLEFVQNTLTNIGKLHLIVVSDVAKVEAALIAYGRSGSNTPADKAAALAAQKAALDAAYDDFVKATTGKVELTSPKATLHPPPNSGAIKQSLDATIKIINDAIKLEEQAYAEGGKELDHQYAENLLSLADYSTQKAKLLEDTFATTQALYLAEENAIKGYLPYLKTQAEQEAALGKIRAIEDQAAADRLKHDQEKLTLTEQLQRASQAYAAAILGVDERYAKLIGDTDTLARLQIQQQDATLRATLAINGQTDALAKLDAIEADLILRAQKDPLSGIKIALADYSKAAQDVAKSTQAATTQMLNNLTDALTKFVTTGKLDFKSMIDSFLADIARLEIQQSITGPLASWLGTLFGGGGGAAAGAGADAYTGSLVDAGAFASGGSFVVGGGPGVDTNLIKFRATAGERVTITPSGQGTASSPHLVYAPTINVDSRADRSQILADVARINQKGNQDLVEMLRRYNPGLRT